MKQTNKTEDDGPKSFNGLKRDEEKQFEKKKKKKSN
jgi:hypothetical protein